MGVEAKHRIAINQTTQFLGLSCAFILAPVALDLHMKNADTCFINLSATAHQGAECLSLSYGTLAAGRSTRIVHQSIPHQSRHFPYLALAASDSTAASSLHCLMNLIVSPLRVPVCLIGHTCPTSSTGSTKMIVLPSTFPSVMFEE
jgi:hypothetical protein